MLSLEEFLKWAVKEDIVSLQQVVAVLKTAIEGRRAQKNRNSFAGTDSPFLREKGTEQVHQILRASTTVQAYAASYARVAQ